jgi:hypothetical protein
MEIRYFQIIIPIVSLFFIYAQYKEYNRNKSGINETVIISLVWISIAILAIFPDFFSDFIADFLGIKSNMNALIFSAIGLLFYFQLKMYKTIKKQDERLTELARKIALENIKNN